MIKHTGPIIATQKNQPRCCLIISVQSRREVTPYFERKKSLPFSFALQKGWVAYRVVVSTAAFHARARGSLPGRGGLKETKMFLPHPVIKFSIVGSLRDREVACSASNLQGLNFEYCVWEGSVISPSSGGSPGPI